MKNLITFFSLCLIVISLKATGQINTFPYVQTGDNPIGWTRVQADSNLWYLAFAGVNPAGATNNVALICNNIGCLPGTEGMIVSPSFNFTSLTKPMVHFYVAYRSRTTQNDSLQFLISLDGGSTFTDVPVPYRKAYNSTPSLATGAPQASYYSPSSANQWRHETIDLSAYAGQSNVVIAFRGVSAFGNSIWIDNFMVINADAYCSLNVTAPGVYSCNSLVNIDMSTIGASLFNPLNNSDNPGGGVLSITQHDNQNPPSISIPVIATNTTATCVNGGIYTPDLIYTDYWFTATYTGNDYNGNATYSVAIDVTTYSERDSLYIIKRADMTAPWVCLNTIQSGDFLVASGLTTFSDFAVAGDSTSQALPVELSSFTSIVDERNVTLNWATVSEINNFGFEVERQDARGETQDVWSKIGFVNGNGNSGSINNYSYRDRNLTSGQYNYRLKQIDFNGNFEYFNLSNEVNIGVPEKFALLQNYPNPFNPSTSISYEVPLEGKVSLKIFDMSGKEVAALVNEVKTAGYYTYNFNASNLSSGVYFYSLSANNFTATKKMMLIK